MITTGYAPTALFHDRERAYLRRRARFAGLVLLIFLGMQTPLSSLDVIAALTLSQGEASSLSEWLSAFSPAAAILYGMVQYAVLLGVPLAIGLVFCRKCGAKPVVKQPVPATHAVALLAAGLAACVFANFVSALIAEWLSHIGVEQPPIASQQNGTLPVLLLTLLSTAVLPAILEELLFRGVILQLLRPAGDLTALILSSVLFGVTHGTVEQIPFATVVGLICGYFVLKTGNIYLGMALHFLNNAMSVVLDCVLLHASDAEAVAWTYSVFIVLTALGLVGWLFLRHRAPHALSPVYDGRSSWMSRAERRRAAWLSPPVLIYIILMLLLTLLATQTARLEELVDYWLSSGGSLYG